MQEKTRLNKNKKDKDLLSNYLVFIFFYDVETNYLAYTYQFANAFLAKICRFSGPEFYLWFLNDYVQSSTGCTRSHTTTEQPHTHSVLKIIMWFRLRFERRIGPGGWSEPAKRLLRHPPEGINRLQYHQQHVRKKLLTCIHTSNCIAAIHVICSI